MKPKLVIAGGTGFLGEYLRDYFLEKGYEIIILSRKANSNLPKVRYLVWDGEHQGSWSKSLESASVVVNLAGKSVNCRYTAKNKRLILESRLNATRAIGKAIKDCKSPPKLWLNAASATIYDHTEEGPANDEYNGKIGDDFSMNVCKEWEASFENCQTSKTRKIYMRIAIVLGKNGGAIPPIKRLVQFGLGGKQGNGKQFISWLHIEDFARIIDLFISNTSLEGGFNCVAPRPVRNAEFMNILREKMGVAFGLPSPAILLKIGAVFIGTEPELILKSRKVSPARLLEAGFEFNYKDIGTAFEEILN